MSDFKLPLPVSDEFTRGVVEMCKTKHFPIWLAFAAQVFLDIKDTLRSQPTKAFNDLRLAGLRTKQIIKDHFKFHETWPDQAEVNWAKQNNGVSPARIHVYEGANAKHRFCEKSSRSLKHLLRRIGSSAASRNSSRRPTLPKRTLHCSRVTHCCVECSSSTSTFACKSLD